MLGLELVMILGVAVLVCHVAGHRFRVAPPDRRDRGRRTSRTLPRCHVTLLHAESLVNDPTALAVYGLAEEHLSMPHVGGLFLLAYGGGTAAGVVTAWLGLQVRRRLDEPLMGNVAVLLIPFTAYLLAERRW